MITLKMLILPISKTCDHLMKSVGIIVLMRHYYIFVLVVVCVEPHSRSMAAKSSEIGSKTIGGRKRYTPIHSSIQMYANTIYNSRSLY
ncbi:hypothetical protein H5410_027505 [Solanum commersonii]|uniref:Uncharacterized protein n=1 Tax=Solanum commersonii TaxID=4109 RepID=A0A9J5Z1G1_SOLCO|nr:hypothetical protein H5410_027505 [Solanum commersonii]